MGSWERKVEGEGIDDDEGVERGDGVLREREQVSKQQPLRRGSSARK